MKGFYWDSHHRFLCSAAAAIGLYLGVGQHVHGAPRLILAWNAFALVSLILIWLIIAGRDPYQAKRRARLTDSSRAVLFALVLSAAIVSLLAVAWMLRAGQASGSHHRATHILLGLATVGVSWFLVHTLFTLRYAHSYYRDANLVPRAAIQGGLSFPGDQPPDYLDFAYFSFVVGMTFQVSDVQITERSLRRTALLHGLISFVFNSAILAILVNVVAGML